MTYKAASRKSETLSVRMPPRLAVRVADAARSDDRSVSEYVREVLRQQLRNTPGAQELARGGTVDADRGARR